MKKNNIFSSLIALLSLLSKPAFIQAECMTSCEERTLSHEERAMDILRDFINPEAHTGRKWRDWIDAIVKQLHGIEKYNCFVQGLKKLKGEKNPRTAGLTLNKYLNLLDKDLQDKINSMYYNQPLKLYSIVSKRMKVN